MKREYHVEYIKYVQHKSVRMSCDSIQFHSLLFLGPHEKPCGVRGLSKKISFTN